MPKELCTFRPTVPMRFKYLDKKNDIHEDKEMAHWYPKTGNMPGVATVTPLNRNVQQLVTPQMVNSMVQLNMIPDSFCGWHLLRFLQSYQQNPPAFGVTLEDVQEEVKGLALACWSEGTSGQKNMLKAYLATKWPHWMSAEELVLAVGGMGFNLVVLQPSWDHRKMVASTRLIDDVHHPWIMAVNSGPIITRERPATLGFDVWRNSADLGVDLYWSTTNAKERAEFEGRQWFTRPYEVEAYFNFLHHTNMHDSVDARKRFHKIPNKRPYEISRDRHWELLAMHRNNAHELKFRFTQQEVYAILKNVMEGQEVNNSCGTLLETGNVRGIGRGTDSDSDSESESESGNTDDGTETKGGKSGTDSGYTDDDSGNEIKGKETWSKHVRDEDYYVFLLTLGMSPTPESRAMWNSQPSDEPQRFKTLGSAEKAGYAFWLNSCNGAHTLRSRFKWDSKSEEVQSWHISAAQWKNSPGFAKFVEASTFSDHPTKAKLAWYQASQDYRDVWERNAQKSARRRKKTTNEPSAMPPEYKAFLRQNNASHTSHTWKTWNNLNPSAQYAQAREKRKKREKSPGLRPKVTKSPKRLGGGPKPSSRSRSRTNVAEVVYNAEHGNDTWKNLSPGAQVRYADKLGGIGL